VTRAGIKISEFLKDKLPHLDSGSTLIRVNRQPCASDQILVEGDRVSATPTKIDAAA